MTLDIVPVWALKKSASFMVPFSLICLLVPPGGLASSLLLPGSFSQGRALTSRHGQAQFKQTQLDWQTLGNQACAARDYSSAIRAYNSALAKAERAPCNERASLYFDRALAFDLSNHTFDATRDFKEALRLYEEYVRLNRDADDLGDVSFRINCLQAQLSLRETFDPQDISYLKNVAARKWPGERLPLRVSINSSAANGFDQTLSRLIEKAICQWVRVPGLQIPWIKAIDEKRADIIVSRNAVEDPFSDHNAQIDWSYKEGDNGVSEVSVVRVEVYCPSHDSAQLNADALANLHACLLHAFGHVLGVDGHSPKGSDVMYWKSAADHLSDRDQAAIKEIYE
jgi:tetratricopeptide (TPR) repeat protein